MGRTFESSISCCFFGIVFIFLVVFALNVFEKVPGLDNCYLHPFLNMRFLKAFSWFSCRVFVEVVHVELYGGRVTCLTKEV